MPRESYDIVVVGGGTSGCFAAATAAREGLDVAILERKSEDEGGHIACGDAIKGTSTFPDVIDLEHLREEAFTNQNITLARFENPKTGEDLDIGFRGGNGAIVDRKRYGEILLEEAERAGAEIHYDTVVQDVVQNGAVTGVTATNRGTPVEYGAEIVLDGAGALSILQDRAEFGETTFDTNVNYQQFCSAYREVIEVDEPVEWDNAIVFKPTAELGYLWYFPRTPTEINVGLGFQMNKEPMQLVEHLKKDVRNREEFKGATVKDKLGAALPTRRPYDSAVAPGYMAIGDAAAHVNPISGGGIAGAAYAGQYAGEQAVEAIETDDVSEETLWRYNERVMDHYGGRYAALDIYNIFSTAYDLDDLLALLASLPADKLSDALYSGSANVGLGLTLRVLVRSFGHWGTLKNLYETKSLADRLLDHYGTYPGSPEGFPEWRRQRDRIMDDIYAETGADAKY